MEIPAGFVRPFRVDKMNCYIWDANHEMAGDFVEEDESGKYILHGVVRPRGWGRIHSTHTRAGGTMEEAETIMDAWENWFNSRVAGLSDPVEIIKRLNAD